MSLPQGRGILVLVVLLIASLLYLKFDDEAPPPDRSVLTKKITVVQKAKTIQDLLLPDLISKSPEISPVSISMAFTELEIIRKWEDSSRQTDEFLLRIQPLLETDDPVIKNRLLESVAEFDHSDAVHLLNRHLSDADPLLRLSIIEGLALQSDDQVGSLLEPYLYDSDRAVRIAAINAVAELELQTLVPALAGLLSDHDPVIRNHTIGALGEFENETSRYYLAAMLNDADDKLRRARRINSTGA